MKRIIQHAIAGYCLVNNSSKAITDRNLTTNELSTLFLSTCDVIKRP